MAVNYTKDQEELMRKLRGEGSNANAFPDASTSMDIAPPTYAMPAAANMLRIAPYKDPTLNLAPPKNPLFQNLPPVNYNQTANDAYRMATNPPMVIPPTTNPPQVTPPTMKAPTYTSSDSPRISGKEWLGNMIGPPIDWVRSFLPSNPVASAINTVDRLVPSATPKPASATQPPSAQPAQAPAYRPARPGEIDPTVKNNYTVSTTADGVKLSNDIGGGEITGLTPDQVSRISGRFKDGYRDTNVVPSTYFTGGAQAGGGTPGFDSDTIARLTNQANARVDIGNMRPADAATALSERNYARQQLKDLRASMSAGVTAQQKAYYDTQGAIAVEQIKQQAPDWKSSDIEVVDRASPTGTRKTQVLTSTNGRTYQVPDAQDIATLAAAPNDEERIRLLRMAGVPDEHIPTYLARFR